MVILLFYRLNSFDAFVLLAPVGRTVFKGEPLR